MKATADIPECWGIHGVSQSGAENIMARKKTGQGHTDSDIANDDHRLVGFEGGGITIHRPLLPFPKSRLKMTCRAMGTQWVEDETNHDLTITPRNTVRHLLSSNRLPLALQKPSLLALAKTAQEKLKEREARANSVYHNCDIITFDLRSGRLLVRLPLQITSTKPFPDKYRDSHLLRGQYKTGLLLRKLTKLISPQENVPLQKLESTAKAIFPDLKDTFSRDAEPSSIPSDSVASFTACGVQFHRLESVAGSTPHAWSRLDPKYIWELARQPYSASTSLPIIRVPSIGPSPTLPPPFHLWDGRYWIRLSNPSQTHTLLIRPFHPSDLQPFRLCVHPARRTHLTKLFKEAAPGKVRWTLPAIAILEEGAEEGAGRGRVLALPTLGFVACGWEGRLKWEVRYKKVELGPGREGRVVR